MAGRKLQIALYWGAACGGCDVAVLDTNEFILEVAKLADVRFWPIAMDGKYADVESLADGELDVAFYSGAVRNAENEEIAALLRRKSRILVAFGACAQLGGIPGLANLFDRDALLHRAYLENPTTGNGNGTLPAPRTRVPAGELEIPRMYGRVYTLAQTVEVDYFLPGCPPSAERVKAAIGAIAAGDLPPRGTILGASDRALCEECTRLKRDKKIRAFRRTWEAIPDPEGCLLEQGVLCAGPATRGGCGGRCPAAGMPCRGCYGPMPGVEDQGAKLLSAVASVVDSRDAAEIDRILDGIPDFLGTSYRFSLPSALLPKSFRR